ncbi:MAG: hypothetical protein U0Q12_15785 [Vicinamibacterales bacterium]
MALATATSGGAAGGAAREPAQVRRVPWNGRQTLQVDSTVGDVRVTGGRGRDIDVQVGRDGPSGAAVDALAVDIASTDETVAVTALQASGGKDSRLRTTITIAMPSQMSVSHLAAFEGTVTLDGVLGGVDAKVDRGAIVGVDLGGRIRLETGSGDVTVRQLAPPKVTSLHLRVFNGKATLGLTERPANARLLFLTLNGSVRSDIPATERAGFGPRFVEAALGTGEPPYSVDVVRGDIVVTVAGGR